MLPESRLEEILARAGELEEALTRATDPQEIVRLLQAYAEIEGVACRIREHRAIAAELDEASGLVDDPELGELARGEVDALSGRLDEAKEALEEALAPGDVHDQRPAVVEVRAGAGGQEAALFVSVLVRMYERYAISKGWSFEVFEDHPTELGGSRETVVLVHGKGVFARLKHEAGVHRVQRVPQTESQGRVHTSTATVAVLPEADAIEVEVNEEDIRIDTMRSSGAGGQHVNVTDSAVRITHLPTGIVVMSSEKSQHRNRAKAMDVLRARLYERMRAESDSERASSRRGQIGSGDRSEKIRTYNFPQSRVTDHRVGMTLHDLEGVLAGGLDPLHEALGRAERARLLQEE